MRQAKLDLSDCSIDEINTFPDIKVDGKVEILRYYFDDREKLKRIPIIGLTITQDWNLIGCKNLESLPEGLTVLGYLSLRDCESLESLPKGLSVRGSLFLNGCKKLKSLPEDLEVGLSGDIYYNGRTGFTEIEGWKDDTSIIPKHLKYRLIEKD